MENNQKNIEVWASEYISKDGSRCCPAESITYDIGNDNTWEKYGKRDNYPDYLLSLYRNSNKHNSIIQTKINLILGLMEFEYESKEVYYERLANNELKKVEKAISETEFKQLSDEADAFFERIKIKQQLRPILSELCVYGGGFITLDKKVYTDLEGVDPKRKISSVKAQKFIYSRRGRINVITNDSPNYNYYCVDFQKANGAQTVKLSNYNKKRQQENVLVKVDDFESNKNARFQSLYFGINDISRDCYPTPDYESKGSLASIESDYELAMFDISEAKNGFVNDYIYVIYRSKIDDDKKEKIQRDKELKQADEQFKGAANNGGFIINWIDPSNMDKDKLDAVKNPFIEIPHNKKYNYVQEKRTSVSKEILSAHGVIVAELAGLQGYGSSGFSSQADMILAASNIWNKQRINPLRKVIETQVLNRLLEDEGISLKVNIKPDPQIERQLTESLMTSIFNEDEIREMFGYAPREEIKPIEDE